MRFHPLCALLCAGLLLLAAASGVGAKPKAYHKVSPPSANRATSSNTTQQQLNSPAKIGGWIR